MEGGTNLYTYGSETNKDTLAGVYCYGTGRKLSLSLGPYTKLFKEERYATKACAEKNLGRNYKNRNI
jgi:hypothetical protein